MAYIDYNAILNRNPVKRLMIAFNNLKANYTESAAKEYMSLYENEPIGFILENSRYIFSEPMFGYKFYLETVAENPRFLMFTELENEKEKIVTFVEENGDQMSSTQKEMYDSLLSVITEKYENTKHTATILHHAISDDSTKEIYHTIVENALHAKDSDMISVMETVENPDLFFALAPYVAVLEQASDEADYTGDFMVAENTKRFFTDCDVSKDSIDENEWKHFIESVVIVSQLSQDKLYMEAVNRMRSNNRILYNGLATESVKNQMDELFIEHVAESINGLNPFNTTTSFDTFYTSPSRAVNRIFEDEDMYALMRDDNEKFKMERTKLNDIGLDIIHEYVTNEYYHCDDTSKEITGFNYFEDGTTVEDAFKMITEAVDGKPTKVVSDHSTDIREEGISSKKVEAPKAKNVANKIQFKAMDAEAKQMKKQATREQKGREIKNAVKAVAAIPTNVMNKIKGFVHKWDEADDDRRKKYIIEPGFRKEAFRNLKLAIMYGATVSVNAAMLPVVFMARHFSKQKNARIRNELARELDTEIRICEEKISDASANGDQQEKYKLMRIKSSLEKEALRVKSNSKYI